MIGVADGDQELPSIFLKDKTSSSLLGSQTGLILVPQLKKEKHMSAYFLCSQ